MARPLFFLYNYLNSYIHMKLSIFIILLLCSLTSCTQPVDNQETIEKTTNNDAIEVTDFAGNKISLPSPAKRIIALSPHIVENIFSAGAGNHLVGRVEYSNYPEQAKSAPIIGSFDKVNYEKIIELKPDLIIAWQSGNSHVDISRLKELGFNVYVDKANTLRELAKSINDIAVLTGYAGSAKKTTDHYLARLDEIENQYKNKPSVSTFYQVWNQPLQTINGDHIISEAISICGGINIYNDQFAVAPIINIESILERNPNVIIASGLSDARPEWLDDWLKWGSLKAVQNNNLFYVPPDHIQRHTLRLLLGIERICEHLDIARVRQ